MKSRSGYLTIALVSMVLGLMLAVQFKVTQGSPADFGTRRTQDVVNELKQVTEERDNLKIELDELRISLNKAISGQQEGYEALVEELNKARQSAGLLEMKGPGITLTLNDSTKVLQPGEDPNLYLIHDEDLLKVVNELKAAGAEAISVNGQRVLATTEIRCAGPIIQVNGNRIAPPFVVTAIGDPNSLESSLNLKGGVLEGLQFWGIQTSIEKPKEVIVPGYSGTIKFKYASPVKEG
jgi:uncharacterized protein YlxW (UPF0749 family)